MATINHIKLTTINTSTTINKHSGSTNVHRLHNWVFSLEVDRVNGNAFTDISDINMKLFKNSVNNTILELNIAGHKLNVGDSIGLYAISPERNGLNTTHTITSVVNTNVIRINLLDTLITLGKFTGSAYYNKTVTYTYADIGKRCYVTDTSKFYDITEVILGVPTWVDAHSTSVTSYTFNESVIGTVPTIIGSMRLPAGTYPTPSAELGAGNPTYSATLQLRKPDGTILTTIGGIAGGLAWRSAATGFTLSTTTDIDLVLYCNTALEPVFVKGLTF